MSETWLDKDISSSILELEGYQLFRNDRAFVDPGNDRIKRGGGLLALVHKELNFTVDHDIEKNISMPDCEMQRLELSSAHQKNIVVYNIYRPPSGSVDSCVELLNHSLENENNLSNKELICMGDFNVNLKEQGPPKRKLMAWSNGLGLTQLIKAHTRNAKSSASMIDLVFTNMDHCNNSGVLDLVLSDHLPVYVIRKKTKNVRRH